MRSARPRGIVMTVALSLFETHMNDLHLSTTTSAWLLALGISLLGCGGEATGSGSGSDGATTSGSATLQGGTTASGGSKAQGAQSSGAPTQRSCKVRGTIFSSGAGLQDPYSCNDCTCIDGELGCTRIGCSIPCADGQVPGTQCAQCSSTGCLVIEYGCFEACMDSCANGGLCLGGKCLSSPCG